MNDFEKICILQKKGILTPDEIKKKFNAIKSIEHLKPFLRSYVDRLKIIHDIVQDDLPDFQKKYDACITRIDNMTNHDSEAIKKNIEDLASLLQPHAQTTFDNLKTQLLPQIQAILDANNKELPSQEAHNLGEVLQQYSFQQLHHLASQVNPYHAKEVMLKSNLSNSHPEFMGLISDCILHEQLKKLEKNLGIQNNNLHDNPRLPCRRMIITTQEVTQGLSYIIDYLESHPHHDIQKISPSDIPHADNATAFEIAWGILDSLLRHRSDHVFVTSSFYSARNALHKLEPHSTLILDGHGSKTTAILGEYKEKTGGIQVNRIKELLLHDTSHAIHHIVLQSCTSGEIKALKKSRWQKKSAIPGKERIILTKALISSDYDNNIFKNIGKLKSFAELLYHAIHKNRPDMAFTFSANVINPTIHLGKGNIAIRLSTSHETRKPWPENLENDKATKSVTIIPNSKHKKSPLHKSSDTYAFSLAEASKAIQSDTPSKSAPSSAFSTPIRNPRVIKSQPNTPFMLSSLFSSTRYNEGTSPLSSTPLSKGPSVPFTSLSDASIFSDPIYTPLKDTERATSSSPTGVADLVDKETLPLENKL